MRFGVESATRTFISSSSFTSRSSLKPAEWRVVQPISRRRELLLSKEPPAVHAWLEKSVDTKKAEKS
jgi:hypothetical protein